MCGITGIIDFTQPVNRDAFLELTNLLQLRGPDSSGSFFEKNVALGHRRLSIIDLETGDQPMYSRDDNAVLVFNGEIYNFLELRAEMEQAGISFRSHSDTEVLLEGYAFFGMEALLQKLEGMFAFALYDRRMATLIIARDKFGEKPLYYLREPNRLVFASELKALEPSMPSKCIDLEGLNLFLSLSYIPAPHTIYQSVRKMMPATFWTISADGEITETRYYNLMDRLKDQSPYADFDVACAELKNLLYDSVKKRMVADVPLGAFLSGGIDSSIITGVMAELSNTPVNTFSIGFLQKEYDESARAQLIADRVKSNHTVHFLDYKDVVELVDDIILYFDEPFGDSSALPSFYVAKLARQKVTVVLTGDCADELFGGYEKYLAGFYSEKFKEFPKFLQRTLRSLVNNMPHTPLTNSILRRAKKVINNASLSAFDSHFQYMCLGFSDADRKRVLTADYYCEVKPIIQAQYDSYTAGNDLEKGFFADLNIVLEGDMLPKVDRMCMKNSLEARVPFLDSRIVEAAYRMPVAFKIKGRNKKYILKETFKALLPHQTLHFRKKGFGVPVDYWFKNQLRPALEALLSKDFIEKQGIFQFDRVESLLQEHLSGKANHKGQLWNLFVFQKWHQQHL